MFPTVLFTAALLGLPPNVSPDLFPEVDKHTSTEIELAGLAALYPGRILHTAPQVMDPGNKDRVPKVVELARNFTYMRVYDLAAAGPELANLLSKPTLIIDLRYVTSDAASAELFADTLAKAGFEAAPVHGVGAIKEPQLPKPDNSDPHRVLPVVLAIVNSQTAGPLEAWLEAFQEKESVLAVGTNTAGQPGQYLGQPQGTPDYYIIEGELRPASGSIVGTGLHPRFEVDVTRQQDYRAYTDVERGNALDTLLRHERPAATMAPPATTATTTAAPVAPAAPAEDLTDPSLQRAVDVVAALQVLGRVPTSPVSGTSTATSTSPSTLPSTSNPAQH